MQTNKNIDAPLTMLTLPKLTSEFVEQNPGVRSSEVPELKEPLNSLLFPDWSNGLERPLSARPDLWRIWARFLNLTWWHGVFTEFLSMSRAHLEHGCVLTPLPTLYSLWFWQSRSYLSGASCLLRHVNCIWGTLINSAMGKKTQRGSQERGTPGERRERREKGSVLGLVEVFPEPFHRAELLTCKLLSYYCCLFFPLRLVLFQ